MSNDRKSFAFFLHNSETSSSGASSPSPSINNSIMNEYIKSATERMIHPSALEVGRMGIGDGIGVVRLHNTFDFADRGRNCARCAAVCAAGCACGSFSANDNGSKYGNNGGRVEFGRGEDRRNGSKFGRRWRKNAKEIPLENEETNSGREVAKEQQNGAGRARRGRGERVYTQTQQNGRDWCGGRATARGGQVERIPSESSNRTHNQQRRGRGGRRGRVGSNWRGRGGGRDVKFEQRENWDQQQ